MATLTHFQGKVFDTKKLHTGRSWQLRMQISFKRFPAPWWWKHQIPCPPTFTTYHGTVPPSLTLFGPVNEAW